MAREILSGEEKELLTLENEIKSARQEKAKLNIEIEGLVKKISQSKEELIAAKSKADGLIVGATKEAENIKSMAGSIYEKAKNTELALQEKIAELEEERRRVSVSQKQANDLIASNRGLAASLKSELDGVNNLKHKLSGAVDIIKKTLEV